MKAISKFKTLLPNRSRQNSPKLPIETKAPPPKVEKDDDATPTQAQPGDEQENALKRANREHAAVLLKERMHVLKNKTSMVGHGHSKDSDGAPKVEPGKGRKLSRSYIGHTFH